MTQLNFSIVIPAYNYAHTLERAVISAVTQKGKDYEVLIVNDGSTDNTEKVATELKQLYPNLRYKRKENGGLASTRNFGIDETNGKFLIFLDADDELTDDALPILRKSIDEHPKSKMIIGGHTSVYEDGSSREHTNKNFPNERIDRFLSYINKKISISNGATAMARIIFDRIRYPENFRNSEDIPVFAQILAIYDVSVLNASVAKIHKHQDSLRHNKNHALTIGTDLTGELFNKRILPAGFMKYRNTFHSQRCLSLFRTLYKAGEYNNARSYYLEAIKTKPINILQSNYFFKFLKCLSRR